MDEKYSLIERCSNCGINMTTKRSKVFHVSVLPPKCQEIFSHWTKGAIHTNICVDCVILLNKYSECTEQEMPERELGHKIVCVCCAQSLLRDKQKKPVMDLDKKYLQYWPWHTSFMHLSVCHKCMTRAKRNFKIDMQISHGIEFDRIQNPREMVSNQDDNDYAKAPQLIAQMSKPPELIAQMSKSPQLIAQMLESMPFITTDLQVILPNRRRAPNSCGACVVAHCKNTERTRIKKNIMRLIATNSGLHVSRESSRMCRHHLDNIHQTLSEGQLEDSRFLTNYNASQLEAYIDALKDGLDVNDFEDVEAMSDHICEYWTGYTVKKFLDIYKELPKAKVMKTTLAVYFIMKKTGDTVKKLANLFNIPSVIIQKQLKVVEKHFKEQRK